MAHIGGNGNLPQGNPLPNGFRFEKLFLRHRFHLWGDDPLFGCFHLGEVFSHRSILSHRKNKRLSVRTTNRQPLLAASIQFPPSALSESGAWHLPQGRNHCFLSAATAAPLLGSLYHNLFCLSRFPLAPTAAAGFPIWSETLGERLASSRISRYNECRLKRG